MASWIVHLRITDLLLNRFHDLKETEFIMGNMAPDSGVPSEDCSYFVPSSKVSHFRDENDNIQLKPYIDKYFSKEVQKCFKTEQFSFYLGYLTHLMTDILWKEQISDPCKKRHSEDVTKDKKSFTWKMKADWYDLDFLFLAKNPDFNAFVKYKNAIGFENTYMDIFSKDAFDNKREYIVKFYSEKRADLEREYPYLSEHEMNSFVAETTEKISNWTKEYI